MENRELAIKVNQEIDSQITRELIIQYLKTFELSGKLNDSEVEQFVGVCVMSKLNPFKREIYCIPYGKGDDRKLSIVTGYEVYVKRASKINSLNGWDVVTTGTIKEGNLKAIITIYRKDWEKPFKWDVLFSEYNQDRNLWKSKPITMLKKVAVAQGFRLCFPTDYDDLPYIEDELPNNMVNINSQTEKRNHEIKQERSNMENLETKSEPAPIYQGKLRITAKNIWTYINKIPKSYPDESKKEIASQIRTALENKNVENGGEELTAIIAVLENILVEAGITE